MIFGELKSKTFFDVLVPLGIVNWLTGLGMYQASNQSNCSYICSLMMMVSINFLHWIFIYIGAQKTLRQLDEAAKLPNFPDKMLKTLVITNVIIAVIAPLLLMSRKKLLTEHCLQKVAALDVKFSRIFGAKNQYGKQYLWILFQIFLIFFVVCIAVVNDASWIGSFSRNFFEHLCVTFTLHHPILVLLLLDLNFCTLVGYVEMKFRDLNESLRQIEKRSLFGLRKKMVPRQFQLSALNGRTAYRSGRDHPDFFRNDYIYLLQETRKTHLELSKMSRKINEAFGIQNLLSIIISFGMTTGLLYTFYISNRPFGMSWLRRLRPSNFSSCLWAAIYASKIVTTNFVCGKVVREVTKTGHIIYELLAMPSLDKVIQVEVQEFSLQMIQNPVSFDVGGFFVLDISSIHGIIGSVTTYLVILIQMSAPYESPSTYPAGNNSTNNAEI
ncbi:putative gustatory receptor 28b isoform X1 [Athalia rosae]|uniref:putative gustatory receptor 28b isoform X1 n=1 Tax=Athalia rosae TaxID=37344 RepID=UPI0020339FA1|nr:putative gustatory receptor 28b isoform X1 [Athalia rosae]